MLGYQFLLLLTNFSQSMFTLNRCILMNTSTYKHTYVWIHMRKRKCVRVDKCDQLQLFLINRLQLWKYVSECSNNKFFDIKAILILSPFQNFVRVPLPLALIIIPRPTTVRKMWGGHSSYSFSYILNYIGIKN